MKRLIIGDIHGCFRELQDLLDKAGMSEGDEIIALGDLVDRGPDSKQVLKFFRTQSNCSSLMGNHERKHIRSLRKEIRPALSQTITRLQIGNNDYEEACSFMEKLPRFLELPEAILVHGFFEPEIPLAEQKETVIVGTMSGEKYLMKNYNRQWYELYNDEKPLVVGHRRYLDRNQPLIYRDRVFGIDTGCCLGGALTGVILPNFKIVSVSSRKNYWEETQDKYAYIRYKSTPV